MYWVTALSGRFLVAWPLPNHTEVSYGFPYTVRVHPNLHVSTPLSSTRNPSSSIFLCNLPACRPATSRQSRPFSSRTDEGMSPVTLTRMRKAVRVRKQGNRKTERRGAAMTTASHQAKRRKLQLLSVLPKRSNYQSKRVRHSRKGRACTPAPAGEKRPTQLQQQAEERSARQALAPPRVVHQQQIRRTVRRSGLA